MTKLEITKRVVRTVVGVSTSFTVANALRNNVPTETKTQKVQVAIGSSAVGALASEAAGKHTDAFFDEIAAAFNQAKNQS